VPSARRAWRPWVLLGAAALGLLAAAPAPSPRLGDPRGLVVEEINDNPAFLVRVDVDHPDRVYREGEVLHVSVRSEKAGYLYLFYCDANKQVTCLFPNDVQSDNAIPANQTITLPADNARFRLRVAPPFGSEILKAVVTTQPLKVLEVQALTKSSRTPLDPRTLEAVFVEVNGGDATTDPTTQDTGQLKNKNRDRAREWSEHHVEVTTLASDDQLRPKPRLEDRPHLDQTVTRPSPGPQVGQGDTAKPRRVGVFVGISRYQDPGIRSLTVAHADAQEMARVMKEQGKLDEAIVLTDGQATLKGVEEVIRKSLPAATRPGDLVVLYWSGHCGRAANVDGTEPMATTSTWCPTTDAWPRRARPAPRCWRTRPSAAGSRNWTAARWWSSSTPATAAA
jgi:hypothetical protein